MTATEPIQLRVLPFFKDQSAFMRSINVDQNAGFVIVVIIIITVITVHLPFLNENHQNSCSFSLITDITQA